MAISTNKINVPLEIFNPLFFHLEAAMRDPKVFYIVLKGGRGSGKSVAVTQCLDLKLINEGKTTHAFREVGKDVTKTIAKQFVNFAKPFVKIFPELELPSRLPKNPPVYLFYKDAYINIDGSDNNNMDRLKGSEGLNYVYYDEIDRSTLEFFEEVPMALRGKDKNGDLTGKKFICSFNPISVHHWIKTKFLDTYEFIDLPNYIKSKNKKVEEYSKLSKYSYSKRSKCGTVAYISTTYRDNFFISGHPAGGQFGYIDQRYIDRIERLKYTNLNNYNIYSLGLWGNPSEGLVWKYTQSFEELKERENKIYYSYYNEFPNIEFYKIWALDFGGAGGNAGDECDGGSKTVLKEYFINKTTRSIYHKLHIYKGYISDQNLIDYMKIHCNRVMILADNARADKITTLKNVGLWVVAAKSKEGGSHTVNTGYDTLKLYNHYIDENAAPERIERENHSWEISKQSGDYSNNQVADKFKDISDCDRYAISYYRKNYDYK